jgi:hypothetical protein
MLRTQVYLTEQEQCALRDIAGTTGKSRSALIREAVDWMIEQSGADFRNRIMAEAAGMWQNRDDLPDFAALRCESDRNVPGE